MRENMNAQNYREFEIVRCLPLHFKCILRSFSVASMADPRSLGFATESASCFKSNTCRHFVLSALYKNRTKMSSLQKSYTLASRRISTFGTSGLSTLAPFARTLLPGWQICAPAEAPNRGRDLAEGSYFGWRVADHRLPPLFDQGQLLYRSRSLL